MRLFFVCSFPSPISSLVPADMLGAIRAIDADFAAATTTSPTNSVVMRPKAIPSRRTGASRAESTVESPSAKGKGQGHWLTLGPIPSLVSRAVHLVVSVNVLTSDSDECEYGYWRSSQVVREGVGSRSHARCFTFALNHLPSSPSSSPPLIPCRSSQAAPPTMLTSPRVQIIDSTGKPLSISDGPLFIWDACAACAGASIIDLSGGQSPFISLCTDQLRSETYLVLAMAFTDLKGGSCAGNNPEGLTIRVLDNNIMEWTGLGSGSQGGGGGEQAPPTPSSSSASSSASSNNALHSTFSPVIHEVVPTPSSSRSPGPSRSTSPPQPSTSGSSGGGCTFGAWQCDGLTLQVCNYEVVDAPGELDVSSMT